jgi:uncharacterized protein
MLRRGYEAFSRGDWESILEMGQPDFELRTADRITAPGTYRGFDEVRAFFEDFFEPFEEIVVEAEEFVERDDRIAVLVRVRSRPKGSTAVVDNRVGHLWTLRDGKAARLEIFPERERMLEALELPAGEYTGEH